MIFYFLICTVLFLIAGGVIFLFYWIPKKLGYPKAGRVLATVITLSLGIAILLAIFEDELFQKNDAKELLAEQDVKLSDNFEILENKSMSAIGDYYHTFTIQISEKDKSTIINQIKRSSNFAIVKEAESARYFENAKDYYTGPKRVKNYETETQFVRELFEPKGQGYAPTYRKIEIDKAENKLIFEDIDE